ncbi:hypothetical protein PAF17_12515 [Paracoccus sp. Z330]|uniref:Uncharacterized protein n=1 Tax=Paracoccus onchidii TaxID=3017813 RepID=A0ABT4ZHW9_9RHOB|nr:hypothetical protein [Paracoccus onchidii]MDB6178320.1 hypothetical protein [Paracoccus onchidii]
MIINTGGTTLIALLSALVATSSIAEARGGFGGGRMGGMHMGGAGHMGGGSHFGGGAHAGGGHHGGGHHGGDHHGGDHHDGDHHGGDHHHDHHHDDDHHHHHGPAPAPYWPGYWDDGDDFFWGATAGLAIGSMVDSVPADCRDVQVDKHLYKQCGNSWFQAAYSGHQLVYISVEDPR